MENLARKWLRTTDNRLSDYAGFCLDLADEVGKWLDEQDIDNALLWIASSSHEWNTITAHYKSITYKWVYHAVILSDGLVHDAWLDKSLPIDEYLATVFPNQTVKIEQRRDKSDIINEETRHNGVLVARRRRHEHRLK